MVLLECVSCLTVPQDHTEMQLIGHQAFFFLPPNISGDFTGSSMQYFPSCSATSATSWWPSLGSSTPRSVPFTCRYQAEPETSRLITFQYSRRQVCIYTNLSLWGNQASRNKRTEEKQKPWIWEWATKQQTKWRKAEAMNLGMGQEPWRGWSRRAPVAPGHRGRRRGSTGRSGAAGGAVDGEELVVEWRRRSGGRGRRPQRKRTFSLSALVLFV